MQTKVYLGDWFLNSGIIGFIRILEHNKDEFCTIKDNYISFDTKNLKNFHKYYFQYFFDKYNVAERTTTRMKEVFGRIENNIIKETVDNKEKKHIQDKIKSDKKYIKQVIKGQLDKIKKFNEASYNIILDEYNKIDNVKEKEDIENLHNIYNVIKSELEKEEVNKRLSMNLFKSILSNDYFGQPSFLNVVKSALSFEEQELIMYKDYISNIIEADFLNDITEGKYNFEELKELISNKLSDTYISKEAIEIYNSIKKKFIDKNKNIEDIQNYIKDEVFDFCYMCENEKSITSNYSESNFIPLAVSSDNMKNFFWNQNAKLPICDICKLMLFCIPAGVTKTSKLVAENDGGQTVYKEKEIYCFVNDDTSIENLKKDNVSLMQNSKKEKSEYNPFGDLILDIVSQRKELSEWELQNIFVVEFESEYLAFSRIEYFNIKRYIARFFIKYSKMLEGINDYRYKLQIIDYMLKNKDFKYAINNRLRECWQKGDGSAYNNLTASRVRLTLNLLKKEERNVEEKIKKNNNKLFVLYGLGVGIHEELKSKGEANKLDGYIYKMLNAVKAGNKKEFMEIVIRIHMSMGRDVSPIFLETMQDSDLDFESIAHSFISGLISSKREEKIDEGGNGYE